MQAMHMLGVIPAGTEVSSFFVHFDTPNVDHQSMQVVIRPMPISWESS